MGVFLDKSVSQLSRGLQIPNINDVVLCMFNDYIEGFKARQTGNGKNTYM